MDLFGPVEQCTGISSITFPAPAIFLALAAKSDFALRIAAAKSARRGALQRLNFFKDIQKCVVLRQLRVFRVFNFAYSLNCNCVSISSSFRIEEKNSAFDGMQSKQHNPQYDVNLSFMLPPLKGASC